MIWALSDISNWLEPQSPYKLESDIPKLAIRYAKEHNLSKRERLLLEEMLKMFDNYNNKKLNNQNLKGILNLLLHSNTKITLQEGRKGKSLFLFAEQMSVKEITKYVLKMVKNRNDIKVQKPPRYRTVFKDKKIKRHFDGRKFSIDASDLQKVRMNFSKKEKSSHSAKKGDSPVIEKGRVIRFSKERQGNIALLPTILNSIYNGGYSIKNKRLNITSKDFLYPIYEENMIYNIMLVLDMSKSISWIIPHIEKFIYHITSSVFNSRDKLGLITFNSDIAQIYHYPTLNVKQVIGTINKLKVKGNSPLGEGLKLALQVFSKDRYKVKGMKNLIILISDCFPEPLEGGHKNLLDEPSYKSVISASKKIKEKKLGFIIINPVLEIRNQKNWAKELIKKIKKVSNVKYIEIHPNVKFSFLTERPYIKDANLMELENIITQTKIEI